MMKVYIAEDEIFQLEDLKISLEELNHNFIGSSDTAIIALEEIGNLQPDVVLVDIHLHQKEAGILLAKKVKELYEIPIIFITSNIDDTIIVKAVSLDPVAYLTKPIDNNNLKAALLLAQSSMIKNNTETIEAELFTRNGNKLHKININEILYAHTDSKNYCTIVMENGKKFSIRNSISGLLKILNHENFVQTHRSFLINWNYLESFSEKDQTIDLKGNMIPVGRTFKVQITKKLRIV